VRLGPRVRRVARPGCDRDRHRRECRDAGAGRHRLGADADLRVADLADPLPFPDGAFDDVIASLVLHYLEDWGPTLAELRRVLRPGGRLITSVHHPVILKMISPESDYFATREWSEEYTFNGRSAVLTYWHRPLHAMTDAFTAAGFRISVISEPPPAPGARELFPDELANFPSGAFLSFLFFVLEAG
jgi:SAM-dependent methyltransferase